MLVGPELEDPLLEGPALEEPALEMPALEKPDESDGILSIGMDDDID